MERLRLRFGRQGPVRFISHLDTVRCWERMCRRASLPLEYSHGFTPHPKIAVAAPLAVGFTSEAELMDIWLRKWLPPESVLMTLRRQLPTGFTLLNAWEMPHGAPALQSMVRKARYHCAAWHEGGLAAAREAARSFLDSRSVVYEYVRGDEVRSVDLRPLVHGVVVDSTTDVHWCSVSLEVSIGQKGSARPDHVLAALGFAAPIDLVHREGLILEGEEQGLAYPESA